MSQSMQSWQFSAPGPVANTLSLNTIPKPSPDSLQPGAILVKVARASLNPADHKAPELGLVSKAIFSYPKPCGMDLSGRVVAVGPEVEDAKIGDVVLARVGPFGSQGALSEYVVVEREAYASLPATFDLDKAAGAPTAALTAYQTIAPYVKKGDRVFINGGSGGVGTFGIQIAKILDCHVTVTCSTGKADLCRNLGADEIIDYKTTDDVVAKLAQDGPVFTLAVDNVGNSPPNLYGRSHEFLAPDGNFVFVGGSMSAGSVASLVKNRFLPGFLGGGKRKFSTYLTSNSRKDLSQIAAWFAEGKLDTVVDAVYDFGEVKQAFEHLKKGSCAGKVIVRVEKD